MANNPRLQVDIGANIEAFQKAMAQVSGRLNTLSGEINKVGQSLSLRLTAPITAAGGAAIMLASDFEESLNKVNVAFGRSSQEVIKFADTTLTQFGIARGTALDMAALFGDMATSMGLPRDAAADMSTSLVGLAGDLASFKNIRIDVANTALKSIFTGETESLKALGVVMTEANLEQFAYQQGIQKSIKEMTQQEKVMLRYQFVLENTKNAQGDFNRTNDGAANQVRIFQESLKQLGQEIGKMMLPLFTAITKRVNEFLTVLSAQSDEARRKFLILAGVLAGIGPTILAIGAGVKALALVFAALSSPITLTIAGVLALSASIDYLAQNAGVFKAIFTNAWLNIKQAVLQSISDMAGGIANFLSYVPNMEGLSNAFFAIGEQVQASADSVEEVAVPAFQSFGEYVDSVKTRLANLATQARNTAAAMLGIQTAEPEAVGAPEDSPILTPIVDGSEEVTESFEEIKAGIIETENAAKQYVSGMVDGFSQMVVQGQKFGDILKNIGRQLLSKGLSTVIKALLVGTTGPLAFLGGAGGTGILGKILPKIFGGAAAAPVMGASPVMDRGMLLRGEFRLDGQDLKLAVDRANQIANI